MNIPEALKILNRRAKFLQSRIDAIEVESGKRQDRDRAELSALALAIDHLLQDYADTKAYLSLSLK